VKDRKNAMFNKTLLGTKIDYLITSVTATARESGINIFDYFTILQREHEQVKMVPEYYLLSNYLAKRLIT
jgi:transposase